LKPAASISIESSGGWFHRYPARFHPDVVEEMLHEVFNALGNLPANLLDPFAGSGTALSCAAENGIRAFGCEINPLALLICAVRFNPPTNSVATSELLEDLLEVRLPGRPSRHPNAEELEAWLGEENLYALTSLLKKVEKVSDVRTRNWFKLAVSSSLRSSSCWLSGSIKPQVDPSRLPTSLQASVRRAARSLVKDCEAETKATKVVVVTEADACRLPFRDNSFDSVLTSPPYLTMYDYFDVHRLTFLAFDWELNSETQIGKQSGIERDGIGFIPPRALSKWYRREFKSEETSDGRALRLYVQRMRTALEEQYRVVRPGGVVCYAVANSIRRSGEMRLTNAIIELMRRAGFTIIETKPRVTTNRRILPANRDTFSGRFTASARGRSVPETIIVARK
jgi:DNA modification methylase